MISKEREIDPDFLSNSAKVLDLRESIAELTLLLDGLKVGESGLAKARKHSALKQGNESEIAFGLESQRIDRTLIDARSELIAAEDDCLRYLVAHELMQVRQREKYRIEIERTEDEVTLIFIHGRGRQFDFQTSEHKIEDFSFTLRTMRFGEAAARKRSRKTPN